MTSHPCQGCGITSTTWLCCPTCSSLGRTSFFCGQECFAKSWKEHSQIHTLLKRQQQLASTPQPAASVQPNSSSSGVGTPGIADQGGGASRNAGAVKRSSDQGVGSQGTVRRSPQVKPSSAPASSQKEESRPAPPEVDSRWANLKPLAGGSALASSSRPQHGGAPGSRGRVTTQHTAVDEGVAGFFSAAATQFQTFLGGTELAKKDHHANAGGSSRAAQPGATTPVQVAPRPGSSSLKFCLVLIVVICGMGLLSWSGSEEKEPSETSVFAAAQEQVAAALPAQGSIEVSSPASEDLTVLMIEAKKTLERHEKMLRYIMDRFVERDDTSNGKAVEPEQAVPGATTRAGNAAGPAQAVGGSTSRNQPQGNLPASEAASSSSKRKRVGSVDGLEAASEDVSESQDPQLSTVRKEGESPSTEEDIPFKNPVYVTTGSSSAVAAGKTNGAIAESRVGYENEAVVPPLVADMVAPVAPEENVKQSSYAPYTALRGDLIQ